MISNFEALEAAVWHLPSKVSELERVVKDLVSQSLRNRKGVGSRGAAKHATPGQLPTDLQDRLLAKVRSMLLFEEVTDEKVVSELLFFLAEFGDEACIPCVLEAVAANNSSEIIRDTGILALSTIGGPLAFFSLYRFGQGRDPELSRKANWALWQLLAEKSDEGRDWTEIASGFIQKSEPTVIFKTIMEFADMADQSGWYDEMLVLIQRAELLSYEFREEIHPERYFGKYVSFVSSFNERCRFLLNAVLDDLLPHWELEVGCRQALTLLRESQFELCRIENGAKHGNTDLKRLFRDISSRFDTIGTLLVEVNHCAISAYITIRRKVPGVPSEDCGQCAVVFPMRQRFDDIEFPEVVDFRRALEATRSNLELGKVSIADFVRHCQTSLEVTQTAFSAPNKNHLRESDLLLVELMKLTETAIQLVENGSADETDLKMYFDHISKRHRWLERIDAIESVRHRKLAS